MPILDVDQLAADGFAQVGAVIPREVGDAAEELLWQRTGLSPNDPSGWAAGGAGGRLVRRHENGPAS
ncbi:hypothetical protein ACQP2K_06475 [Microbispora siamensis]